MQIKEAEQNIQLHTVLIWDSAVYYTKRRNVDQTKAYQSTTGVERKSLLNSGPALSQLLYTQPELAIKAPVCRI